MNNDVINTHIAICINKYGYRIQVSDHDTNADFTVYNEELEKYSASQMAQNIAVKFANMATDLKKQADRIPTK